MTTSQRMAVSQGHTNGAAVAPWWANAVVYQVYPRSFQDANNDGIGDLRGIINRLPYLAWLGVDVIWLSPVYRSPQDDNGYDISNYQDIDPMFGTLADMDELLSKAHEQGIKIVMDLVVNHTSDEHAWFQASRDQADPHADWYWWRPAKPGHEPGTPGAEPNEWGSFFGGSAWAYDEKRGEYYLHLFSPKQPDLNWENPKVRKAVYQMMNWWMDRGVDGFRMDVITLVSKTVDESGKLPGEAGSQIADHPAGADGYSSAGAFCCDGPRMDEFLKEMNHAVFAHRDGYVTVGEAIGVSPERAGEITDPKNEELDMLFLFDHMGIDQGGPGGKFSVHPWKVADLRNIFTRYEQAVADAGWTSLYFNNHDQPRIVSRWGDDSSEAARQRSAKALALLLHLHRGTPYIYQGEELGMTNAGFTQLDQYRDLESINMYRQLVEETGLMDHDSMMAGLAAMGRDNSRTPMQWDATANAGFSSDANTTPWISVNPNYTEINAQAQQDDVDSVLNFYRQLIELRHTNELVSIGSWEVLGDDAQIYAFIRTLGTQKLLVMANLSKESAKLPVECTQLLHDLDADSVLISNDDANTTIEQLREQCLQPWSALAYLI